MNREDAQRMVDFQNIEKRIRESAREMANLASVESRITNDGVKATFEDIKDLVFYLEQRVEELEDRVEELEASI